MIVLEASAAHFGYAKGETLNEAMNVVCNGNHEVMQEKHLP